MDVYQLTYKDSPLVLALLIMMSLAGSSPFERSAIRETNTGTTGTTVKVHGNNGTYFMMHALS